MTALRTSLTLVTAAVWLAPLNVEAASSDPQTDSESVGHAQITLKFDHAPCERNLTAETPIRVEIAGKRRQVFTLKPSGPPVACQGLAGLLQQDDFNFDGYPDFAVALDFTGGRGGASYRVFVFQPNTGTFVPAPKLSSLTQRSIGLFGVDHEKKRLIVDTRSGCCVDLHAEYSVQGLKPIEELSVVTTYSREADHCSMEIERTVRGQAAEVTRGVCPADAE